MSVYLGRYGTTFGESEILLAISNDDVDYARAILAEMMPGERRALEHQCEEVINLIQAIREDEE